MRNCTIRILDNTFIDYLRDLSANEDFNKCLNLSEGRYLQRYDEGLVLRFFAFKNYRDKYVHDVEDFMTEYAEEVAGKALTFDYLIEKFIFEKTFRVLKNTMDLYSFTPMNEKGQCIYRFSSYHFEAFTLGIQKYLQQIDPLNETQIERLRNMFIEIKTDPEFRSITAGGGKNSSKQLQERIEFVESKIGRVL